MKHKVLIIRTECAEMEVEAGSAKEARAEAARMIDDAGCWADLDLEWEQDGGIKIESLN